MKTRRCTCGRVLLEHGPGVMVVSHHGKTVVFGALYGIRCECGQEWCGTPEADGQPALVPVTPQALARARDN